MKRSFTITLAAIIILVSFLGCQNSGSGNEGQYRDGKKNVRNSDDNAYPIFSRKTTFRVMGAKQVVQGDWAQMDVVKKMEDITNVVLDFNTPASTNYEESKYMAFTNGDLPDFFFGGILSLEDEELYGKRGVLVPLEKMIKSNAPHLSKLLDSEPQVRRAITSLDGHIYALPYIVRTKTTPGTLLYINTEWLKNVNMQMPENTDELYTVLKAFKEKDPNRNGKFDEIPLSAVKLNMIQCVLLCAFGDAGGGPQSVGSKYSNGGFTIKNGKVIYSAIQPYYREYLAYVKKLYSEGLLDNQTFTQSLKQMTSKGKTGRLGILTAPPSNMLNPDNADKYLVIPPLTSPINKRKMTKDVPGITTGTFAITNKCKYPEEIIKWVDIFYRDSEDAVDGISGLSMFLGVEGVNWEFTDSTKARYRRIARDPELSFVENTNLFFTPGGAVACPSKVVINAEPEGDKLLALKASECEKKYFPYMVPVYPQTVRYTKEQSERIAFLQNDIDSYVEQMTARFIIGEEPLDKWNEYVETLKRMNIAELAEIRQDAYDRWKQVK